MMEPKIRFKGFEGEWRKAKLGDIATFSKGSGYSKSDLCKEGSPIVLYGRLYTKYQSIIDEIDTFVAPKANSVISTGGEVIIPASGESPEDISLAATIKNAGVIIGGDLNVLKFDCNNNNPDFMTMAITYSPTRSELSNYSQGKTVVHLRNSEIAKGNVCFPRIEEQKAIVNYVLSLDSQISVCTSRLASLKQMKAASLQAMFPQEGETVPKIRFKGFEGEWKKVKLGDIAKFSKGQGYSKSDLKETGHPIILYGRMYTKYQFAIDEVDTFANLKDASILSEGNEIIMPASGETPEDIACASAVLAKDIILGGDLNIMHFDLTKFSTPFIALGITYCKTHHDLSKCAQGKSVVHLHNGAISRATISLPSLAEQQAIASYFTSLDRQISLQSQRLEKLKQIKSACLDKMFV